MPRRKPQWPTRIRYKNIEDNKQISMEPIICQNSIVNVTIDTINCAFEVIDVQDGRLVASGHAHSNHSVKINAKKACELLGARFVVEEREKEYLTIESILKDDGEEFE